MKNRRATHSKSVMEVHPMSLSNEPVRSMLAPYVPPQPDPHHLEDLSFRFGEGESLKGIWQVIRKRKLTIAVGGLCGLALAFLACLLMAKQYGAVATIEVEKTDASQTSLLNNAVPLASNMEEMKTDVSTHMKVLQSPNVVLAAVRDLNLQSQAPFAFKPTVLGAITGTNSHIRDEISQGLPLDQDPYSRELLHLALHLAGVVFHQRAARRNCIEVAFGVRLRPMGEESLQQPLRHYVGKAAIGGSRMSVVLDGQAEVAR